ncbi:MAG: hypothetical protein JO069_04970 [Verrucomicrobia bacterium]|nr:hypothetical protein [Verrucomicrobiota bacterium]
MRTVLLVWLIWALTPARPLAAAPASEAVLILTLSARVARPAENVAPAPPGAAPSEAGRATPQAAATSLGRRAFRLTRRSQDFEAVADGILGQQVVVRFTAALLPAQLCAITSYEAFGLAKPEPGRPFGAGSTLQANQTGFAFEPGQQVERTVTAGSEAGTVIYVLDFTALKVFGNEPKRRAPHLFDGW